MGQQHTGRSGRSDAELLSAHVAGDRNAFGELFARHRGRLRHLARSRSRCPEDADDALQEAMLSVHRSAATFRHGSAVSSWLHRIVLNACLDGLRQHRIQMVDAPGDWPAPGDHTAAVETALAVRAALLRLPVGQRTAVVAVDMHGYSIADAARMIGVAEGTVKSRCARGRARLAVLLAQFAPAAPLAAPAPARPIPWAAHRGRVDDCA